MVPLLSLYFFYRYRYVCTGTDVVAVLLIINKSSVRFCEGRFETDAQTVSDHMLSITVPDYVYMCLRVM